MASKWMAKLAKIEGAVVERKNPHNFVIRTHSPSVNFTFGNGWGLPLGYSLVLYGPPKGGKSLLCNSMIGQLHKDDPEAIAVKFNTEMREAGQLGTDEMAMWGIDPDRYMGYDVNTPDGIFDVIEHQIAAMCQEGAPIKLIIIDSVNAIQGRRAMNNTSVLDVTIGDMAMTMQEGLKRILAVQRKYGIALILVTQIRGQMDPQAVQRGEKVKMAASFALQHHAEYFCFVEKNETKAGRTALDGSEFKDESLGDVADRAEKTGHKIRVVMKDSSMGPKGRMGEFTLDYKHGVTNIYEEVFLLGTNRGIIKKPNQLTYTFNGENWKGQQAILDALKQRGDLRDAILSELKQQDRQGKIALTEAETAESAVDI